MPKHSTKQERGKPQPHKRKKSAPAKALAIAADWIVTFDPDPNQLELPFPNTARASGRSVSKAPVSPSPKIWEFTGDQLEED